jgi:hypothetical protein
LVGKDIDHLSVAGLGYQENPILSTKVQSDGGDGQWGSVRQRYAEMTVYLPELKSVCVRGAMRGLIVENLVGSITIVPDDSTDSDARARFEIRGLTGNLICHGFPLHLIANVKGHVAIESLSEFAVEGGGTHHRNDLREMTSARPFAVAVRDVTGGIELRYGRVNLELQQIDGIIDVENEFGDTSFSATGRLADAAHRIVSISGRINATLSGEAWDSVPVIAVTNHGGLSTNVGGEEFGDFHLSGQDKLTHKRRNWSGFRKVISNEDQLAVFKLIDRFSAMMQGAPRSSGLDLMSRNGRIHILRTNN